MKDIRIICNVFRNIKKIKYPDYQAMTHVHRHYKIHQAAVNANKHKIHRHNKIDLHQAAVTANKHKISILQM